MGRSGPRVDAYPLWATCGHARARSWARRPPGTCGCASTRCVHPHWQRVTFRCLAPWLCLLCAWPGAHLHVRAQQRRAHSHARLCARRRCRLGVCPHSSPLPLSTVLTHLPESSGTACPVLDAPRAPAAPPLLPTHAPPLKATSPRPFRLARLGEPCQRAFASLPWGSALVNSGCSAGRTPAPAYGTPIPKGPAGRLCCLQPYQ